MSRSRPHGPATAHQVRPPDREIVARMEAEAKHAGGWGPFLQRITKSRAEAGRHIGATRDPRGSRTAKLRRASPTKADKTGATTVSTAGGLAAMAPRSAPRAPCTTAGVAVVRDWNTLQLAMFAAEHESVPGVRIAAALDVARQPGRFTDAEAIHAMLTLLGSREAWAARLDDFDGCDPLDPDHPRRDPAHRDHPGFQRTIGRIFGAGIRREQELADPIREVATLLAKPKRRRAYLADMAECADPELSALARHAQEVEQLIAIGHPLEVLLSFELQRLVSMELRPKHDKANAQSRAEEAKAGPLARRLLPALLMSLEAFARYDMRQAASIRAQVIGAWNQEARRASAPWQHLAALCDRCGRPLFMLAKERQAGGRLAPPSTCPRCRAAAKKKARRSSE